MNTEHHNNMKSIHAKDTAIEIKLRKALWAKEYHYRKNYFKLPGKPDMVLTKYKNAIFCDGDFFRGRDWEVLKPKLLKGNNVEFWVNKITRNRKRDDEINKKLLFEGWTVIRLWEKEINQNIDECVKAIEECIWEINVGNDND